MTIRAAKTQPPFAEKHSPARPARAKSLIAAKRSIPPSQRSKRATSLSSPAKVMKSDRLSELRCVPSRIPTRRSRPHYLSEGAQHDGALDLGRSARRNAGPTLAGVRSEWTFDRHAHAQAGRHVRRAQGRKPRRP